MSKSKARRQPSQNSSNLKLNFLLASQSAVTVVTIHKKGDTRKGGEMYLPTMKVRASLRMKGMRE